MSPQPATAMQLTPHFTLAELTASTTATRLGIDNTPPAEIVPRLIMVAEMLERIRADVKRACLVGRGALSDEVGAVGVLTYTGTDMQARSDGAGSEAVAVRFTANYREAYGDPTQAR